MKPASEEAGDVVLEGKILREGGRHYGCCTKEENIKITPRYAPVASPVSDPQFIGVSGLRRNEAAAYRVPVLWDV